MIQLTANACSRYIYTGAALIVVQLSIFIFALPPFQAGIWLQVEPMQTAWLIFATLQGLWCAWGITSKQLKVYYHHHPLWWWLHVWVMWQILMLPFAEHWWRSWFGYPGHGIGVSWHIAVWLTALLTYALWCITTVRKIIIFSSVALLLLQTMMFALLRNNPAYNEWLPATFGGYLAHMAAWMWIIYVIYKRRLHYTGMLMIAVIIILAVYVSAVRAAILFIIPALFASYLAKEYNSIRFISHPSRVLHILALFALIAVWCGWNVISLQPSLFPDKRDSVAIRVAMHEVGNHALHDNPERLLTGKGWGSFYNDSFRYALTSGTYFYKNGEYKVYAPLYENPAFHSHDQALEALLGLGVIGLLLWFSFPITILYSLPRQYFWSIAPMFMAIIVMSYLWFYFPIQLAYIGIGYGALARVCIPKKPARVLSGKWASLLMCLLAIAMGASVLGHYKAMLYGTTAFKSALSDSTQESIMQDIARGGDRLTFIIQQGLLRLDASMLLEDKKWKNKLVATAETLTKNMPENTIAAMLQLQLQNVIYQDHAYQVNSAEAWEAAVLHVAKIAPARDDIATPFLIAVDTSPFLSPTEKNAIYKELLSVNPGHRVAQWLQAKITFLNDPHADKPALKAKMFALLQNRLAEIFPINQTDTQWLESQ